MKHKNIEKLIQKLLDREIKPAEERRLHSHLAECQDCQREYEEYVRAAESLGQLTEFFPAYGFNERVMTSLGLKRAFAWRKVIQIFAGAWVVSLLVLLFGPFTSKLTTNLLTSAPAVVRLIDKISVIVNSLNHTLLPFARLGYNPIYPAIGLVFSIILVYVFTKAIKKEVQCSS